MNNFQYNELRRTLIVQKFRSKYNDELISFKNTLDAIQNVNYNNIDFKTLLEVLNSIKLNIKKQKFYPKDLIQDFFNMMNRLIYNFEDCILLTNIMHNVKWMIVYNIDIITNIENIFEFNLILEKSIYNYEINSQKFLIISSLIEIICSLYINDKIPNIRDDKFNFINNIFLFIDKYKNTFFYKEFNIKIFWLFKNLTIINRERKITHSIYFEIQDKIEKYFRRINYEKISNINIYDKDSTYFFIELFWFLLFYFEKQDKIYENIKNILYNLLIIVINKFELIDIKILIPFYLLINKFFTEDQFLYSHDFSLLTKKILGLENNELNTILYIWLNKLIKNSTDIKIIDFYFSLWKINENNKYFFILMNTFYSKFYYNNIYNKDLHIYITNNKYSFDLNEKELIIVEGNFD